MKLPLICVLAAGVVVFGMMYVGPSQWRSARPAPVSDPAASKLERGRLVSTSAGKVARPAGNVTAAGTNVSAAGRDDAEPAEFVAFAGWMKRYFAGNGQVSLAQGEALAWKRREVMKELIENDPGRAVSLALPFAMRSKLPEKIARHLETPVDGHGTLEVLMAEDFLEEKNTVIRYAIIEGRRYEAFVYGRRRDQVSQTGIPLHGIALDGKLAVLSEPVRRLDVEEAAWFEQVRRRNASPFCSVCNADTTRSDESVAGELGGEVGRFCSPEHLRLVNQRWEAAESGGAGVSPFMRGSGGTWSLGTRTVLYMRVNFPDDLTEPIPEAEAYRVMMSVNDFYTEGSYNQTALMPTVTPLLTLPYSKPWYSTAGPGALLDDAREVARKAGFDTANYNLDIVAFTPVPGYDWGGLGAVHGKGTWLQSMGVGVTAHELGHNYGLPHANWWNTSRAGVIGAGANVEYGNIYDTMGAASGNANHFGALFKTALSWMATPAVHDVTTNGVYRLYPFDQPLRSEGRRYAARVRKDYDRDYWLEFRRRYAGNDWMRHGVLVNWSPWTQTGGTSLLDMTPGSPTASRSREDAALVIGSTFNDEAAGVFITPVAQGTTGTNDWIEVQVNAGDFSANRPPAFTLEVEQTNATPGALMHFRAQAVDPDGDPLAYAWSFDDFTFSTNNLPWTYKIFSAPGDYLVRCVVSDMKGGVASANAVVQVGNPAGFRVAGRVTDLNGVPVENVRVDNSGTNLATWRGGFTDSQGRFIVVGVTADLQLDATKYGFVITNTGWSNPISITGSVANADFVAVPLPGISITVSTNAIAENDSTGQFFTVRRTGDNTNDLTVALHVSGTAEVDLDYTLGITVDPTNTVVTIPSGSNDVTIAFQTRNDSQIEGPETATITVLDDPAYVVVKFGEAAITILDDDAAAKPEVSIAVLNRVIGEIAMDDGEIEFTRTGDPSASLAVNYNVSGSATAGKDYATLPGVVVIPAGSRSVWVRLHPWDDQDVEGDETVSVTLAAGAAYTIGDDTANFVIVDDDRMTVTIQPTGQGAAEPGTAGEFTIKRDGDLTAALVVNYTVSGTASNGVDFQGLPGSVTIPAARATATIPVQPKDDPLVEGDESVTLTLLSGVGVNIGTAGSATLFIQDNEKATVTVTAGDDLASEPGEDTGAFTISRGGVTSGNLSVSLTISGSAMNGIDYVPVDSVVVIPDGQSEVTFDLIPFDDLHLELTEDVILAVLPGTNYNAGTPDTARVKIDDDDASSVPAVGFTSAFSSAPESESPGISVSLSHTSTAPITVEFRVIGGTAPTNDYSLPSSTLSFDPGEWAKSLPLTIVNNALPGSNRTVRLVIFNPNGATLDGIKIHTYTILDEDRAVVSVTATTNTASETGPKAGSFRITRTGSTNTNAVVNFQLTGTATAPTDFVPIASPVIIPVGATFVDIPVTPVQDSTVELDETIVLTLTSIPGGAVGAPNRATVTLADNDTNPLPVVIVSSTNRPYAVEGGGSGEFAFTRSTTNGSLTLFFTLTGMALNGQDYSPLTNQVSFPAGQSVVTLPVQPVDDALVEGEETVVLSLMVNDTYRAAFPASAIVTIQDNDQNVRVDPSDFLAAEPGTNTGEFTFTRFGTTNTDLRVFFTMSGSASNGVDYVSLSNSFVIPAGSLAAALTLQPLDDLLVEGPETAILALQSHPAYSFGAATSATITLDDNEPMLTLTATVTNCIEGGTEPGVFTLTRTGDPQYEVTARIAIGGTAAPGADYPPLLSEVFIQCGMMSVDLLVWPTNELAIEGLETVTAALLPSPSYSILSPSNGVVNIEDATTNKAPLVLITSPTVPAVFLLGTNVGIVLEATVTDDGDTNTPPTVLWSKVAGPDSYLFGATNTAHTTIVFTNIGVYVLRIEADDGQLKGAAELTVVVNAEALLATHLLHWSFADGTNTTAADASGHSHDGVLVGPPSWDTNGALGSALLFHGANDHVRLASPTNLLDGLDQFSLALWVNHTGTNLDLAIFTADDASTNATLSLQTHTLSSCGHSTNVLEALIPTTGGVLRRVSDSRVLTNGWQHLVLTWSNGLAPALFINGRLDQPLAGMLPVSGVLTNCPQFIVGKGPLGGAASWQGLLDEVRLFPRALTAPEVAALAALPPANYGPFVFAGTDATIQLITPDELDGIVEDDGQPTPPAAVSNIWLQVTGPSTVTLTNANALTNVIQFTQAGDYLFRLLADDGQVKVFDDLALTIIEPTRVDLYASDPDAAELGPDTGEFTLNRNGATNELSVFLLLSGTASNGVDFVQITNVVVFPQGTDTVTLLITPFLDHRTEGDEPLKLTLMTNLAYSIGSPEATVTLHDSPYGMWNIANFTLEELTDPRLSGETADFDLDRLMNFVEYAFHRDPRIPDTNAPLLVALELDPQDGTNHLTLTFQRRLEPTDVSYEPAFSYDLANWITGTNNLREVTVTDDGNGLTQTVKAQIVPPYTTLTNHFVTIRFWLRATLP